MKRFLSLTLILLLLILFAFTVLAHPGRTDSNGGHYNKSTGEYHYHHGYSEHQHPNGECPYDFDDKTSIDWDEYYQKAKEKDAEQYNQMKEYATQRASTTQSSVKTTSDSKKSQSKYSDQEKIAYSAIFFLIITVIVLLYKLQQKCKDNRNKALLIEDFEKTQREQKEKVNRLNDNLNFVTKKHKALEAEHKSLQRKYETKCTSLENLEIKFLDFKKSLDEIEARHFENKKNYELERSEIIKQTEAFVAESFGILSSPILPDETIPQYITRILNNAVTNEAPPFVFTSSTTEEHEKLSTDFANTIRRKYEIKGYTVTLFKSENTLEKYLFAYNKTNLLLIQCVYLADEQVCTAEHILALQASLSKFQQKNNRNNVKALIITNTTLSEDAKALADELHFYYRENK